MYNALKAVVVDLHLIWIQITGEGIDELPGDWSVDKARFLYLILSLKSGSDMPGVM